MIKRVLFGLVTSLLILICISACNIAGENGTTSSQESSVPTGPSDPVSSNTVGKSETVSVPIVTTVVPKTTGSVTTTAPQTPLVTDTVTDPPKTTPVQTTAPTPTETTKLPQSEPSVSTTEPSGTTTAPAETSLQIGNNDNEDDWGPLIPMETTEGAQ